MSDDDIGRCRNVAKMNLVAFVFLFNNNNDNDNDSINNNNNNNNDNNNNNNNNDNNNNNNNNNSILLKNVAHKNKPSKIVQLPNLMGLGISS